MSLDATTPSGEAPLVPHAGAALITHGGSKLVYIGLGTWRDTLRVRVVDGGYETDVLIADVAHSAELTAILNPS